MTTAFNEAVAMDLGELEGSSFLSIVVLATHYHQTSMNDN